MQEHHQSHTSTPFPPDSRDKHVEQETRACAKPGDILAVHLLDGSEAIVHVCGYGKCMEYPGYTKKVVRVDVLKPTGPYVVLWYRAPGGEHRTPYEYSLPTVSDPTHGQDWEWKPLNTFRILGWDELQPLTIIPLYRGLDAAHGAAYATKTYESDQGRVIAAKIYLQDAGYTISPALRELYVFCEWDWNRFRVCAPGERLHSAKVWTCQELVDEALRLRGISSLSEGLVRGT